MISKRYASSDHTEALSSMKDASTKTFTQGLCLVVGGFTDGVHFIPVELELWVCEEIMQNFYKKKSELAEKIIENVLTWGIKINCFVLDGLYFSERFIKHLQSKNLKFIIKAKTTTVVEFKNKKTQLQHCSALRLNSNQNQKKIAAKWNGMIWYFIAMRRSGRRGEKFIYLIANFVSAKTKNYCEIYDSRWKIEKFIRTAKQHLGLKSSQSQQSNVYLNHIKLVFEAYTILQFIMRKFKLKSAEEALRKVQAWKKTCSFSELLDRISLLVNYA